MVSTFYLMMVRAFILLCRRREATDNVVTLCKIEEKGKKAGRRGMSVLLAGVRLTHKTD